MIGVLYVSSFLSPSLINLWKVKYSCVCLPLLVLILREKQVWNCFSRHMKIMKIQNFLGLHPWTLNPIGGNYSVPQTSQLLCCLASLRFSLQWIFFLPWTHLCKIDLNCKRSNVDSPYWIKNKNATKKRKIKMINDFNARQQLR